jgi:HK97 gp10 family phage protein
MEEFNHFDQLADEYDKKVGKLVRAAALKIERGAKERAPVDTGFLRNSIYVITEDFSDDAGSFRRLARLAHGIPDVFPKLPAPGHNEALVAVGANYGVFVEYGTSRQGAHPYFTPAVEAERWPFEQALSQLMESAGIGGFGFGDIDIE